jgi:hypothetical protein
MTGPVNVICMKWGALYGPHYVDRLASMVRRHLARPHRFLCFTDDPAGLDPRVETAPLPPIRLAPEHAMKPWRKIGLFNPTLADLTGPTLFLDLDLVVVGALDPFFDHEPGKFCIIHNWTHPDRIVGNSSVYRFEPGADSYVLERFHSRPHQHWIDTYRNSQTFLSHSVNDMRYWPEGWCVSFKKHCLPRGLRAWIEPARAPDGARIVVFHGSPNPDDALAGRWPEPEWWKRPFKRLRPAPWIAEHWR